MNTNFSFVKIGVIGGRIYFSKIIFFVSENVFVVRR